jgi:hypothetical protein
MVDAFAGGYTMCRSGRHWMNRHYTKIAFEGTVRDSILRAAKLESATL